MPIYTIQGPDGRKYKIEGPEGATAEQLAGVIQGQQQAAPQPQAQQQPAAPQEEQRSFLQDVRGGLASAPINMYLGAKQLLGGDLSPVEQDVLRQNREAEARAPVSSVASNVLAAIPAAMIPGANTIAGGALIGAGQGAIQPTLEGESRLANAAVGGVAGALVPAAIKGIKTAKAVIDPFTKGGRDNIAAGVIKRAAADPNAVTARLLNAKGNTPGFSPTVGQAADDAGLASIERAIRAAQPGAFDATDKAQRQALADALRGVAKDPIARQAAVEARESAANTLYGKAFQSDAMRRSMAAADDAARAPFSGVGMAAPQSDLATPGLRSLAERPMFRQAMDQAKTLAANKGVRLDDPLQSLEGLHYIKLALDDMANPGAMNPMGKNANAAVNQMRSALTDELATVAPSYGAARSAFADMSRPINQMDVGQAFTEKLIPALYRDMDAPVQLNASAYARALADQGDDIARNVTGMSGATLDKVMDPAQLQTMRGVGSDLQMMKVAENAGRGVGSDTIQKTAMSHIAAKAGIPNWVGDVAGVAPVGGMLKRAGDFLYGKADDQVLARMAELLANPREAGMVLQSMGLPPSATAQVLERAAITAGQSLPGLAAQ